MQKKKNAKRFFAVIASMAMALTMQPAAAFAEDAELDSAAEVYTMQDDKVDFGAYPTGSYYLGYCTVNNSHLGGYNYFYGNYMKIKPAWKPIDSTTSEIDMYIEVRDVVKGEVVYKHRFTPSEDKDGRDSDKYWYVESPWFEISNGAIYQIYYEAFTAPGYTPTGQNRRGTCCVWFELKN